MLNNKALICSSRRNWRPSDTGPAMTFATSPNRVTAHKLQVWQPSQPTPALRSSRALQNATGAFIYNSAVFTDGRSEPVIYRKSHLYGDYERAIFAAGDPTATIVAWRGLKLGLLICYDVEFPENVRRLALAGADLVAVPTALPVSPEAEMIAERVIAVRAFENQIFVAYANHTGRDDRFAYAGLSHVAAPDGSTLAKASATEAGLIIAELQPGEYGASRAANTYLRDLRR